MGWHSKINARLGIHSTKKFHEKFMFRKLINIIASTGFAGFIAACAIVSDNGEKINFGPIRNGGDAAGKCAIDRKPLDSFRPKRGIIEGSSSFLTPAWDMYVVDLDAGKLSKVESVWTFESGKPVSKPAKAESITLNFEELQSVVAPANAMWASPEKNPSLSATDVAWHIELVDGAEKRCETGLGRAAGNGDLLSKAIYRIWKSHKNTR
ncbi:hypothetical protein [Paraburkholderia fynbosensis]|uniref:Uncharacterized protein n=1 Tax=Paraburkholderia fynbosensis TaxID=1200993 RepID=A0A6J5GHY1_9BURK|nr:hypothetical protein [Paraburkholderia fynbosensis]CAB3799652.1 hypothetical protein LMG27177_04684 [Paraburkholderia fynbosensis]